MNKKYRIFNEENIVLLCFIALGVFWIIKAQGFVKNPTGLNPSFFPTFTATLLILFCTGTLVQNIVQKSGQENDTEKKRWGLIATVVGLLIALIVLCKYAGAYVGIPVFLFAYMWIVAGVKPVKNLLITAISSGVIFAALALLHIHM